MKSGQTTGKESPAEDVSGIARVEYLDDVKLWVVQLENGSFLGQKWHEIQCQNCHQVAQSTRTYPTYRTKMAAQCVLDKHLRKLRPKSKAQAYTHMFGRASTSDDRAFSLCQGKSRVSILKRRTTTELADVTCKKCLSMLGVPLVAGEGVKL